MFGAVEGTNERETYPRFTGREGSYLERGGSHCRFLIGRWCDKSGFQKISLSSGRMRAKNTIQVYRNEGLAVGRGSHTKNIYSTPKDILSKQCAMGNLFEKSVCLKYVY